MTAFIQESGIVTAMVGLSNAPRGTKLYERLVSENRLLKTSYRRQHRPFDELHPEDGS